MGIEAIFVTDPTVALRLYLSDPTQWLGHQTSDVTTNQWFTPMMPGVWTLLLPAGKRQPKEGSLHLQ